MSLDDYRALFGEALSRTGIAVPEGSLLYRAAEEVLEMAVAYRDDGMTFLSGDDPVNALAGFAYGLGWLDAGLKLGLLAPPAVHPPGDLDACIPMRVAHLREKTHRYGGCSGPPLEWSRRRRIRRARFTVARGRSMLWRSPGIWRGWNALRLGTMPAPSPDSVTGMHGSMPASVQDCYGSPVSGISLRSRAMFRVSGCPLCEAHRSDRSVQKTPSWFRRIPRWYGKTTGYIVAARYLISSISGDFRRTAGDLW